jgi:hypothetical protein
MMNLLRKTPYYLPLLGVFGLGLLAFLTFPADKFFLSAIIISMSAAYVSWGALYHIIHKDFSVVVLIEYVSIAILASVATLAVLG